MCHCKPIDFRFKRSVSGLELGLGLGLVFRVWGLVFRVTVRFRVGVGVGFMVWGSESRVSVREPAPICISRESTYLLVSSVLTFNDLKQHAALHSVAWLRSSENDK